MSKIGGVMKKQGLMWDIYDEEESEMEDMGPSLLELIEEFEKECLLRK